MRGLGEGKERKNQDRSVTGETGQKEKGEILSRKPQKELEKLSVGWNAKKDNCA